MLVIGFKPPRKCELLKYTDLQTIPLAGDLEALNALLVIVLLTWKETFWIVVLLTFSDHFM